MAVFFKKMFQIPCFFHFTPSAVSFHMLRYHTLAFVGEYAAARLTESLAKHIQDDEISIQWVGQEKEHTYLDR